MPETYRVRRISSGDGKAFIHKHHYSRGSHNNPICYGLYDDEILIGVIAFARPCSERVCASIFGEEHKNAVTELHRLVLIEDTPKNAESWLISRGLKLLKREYPHIWAVVSFADPTAGHVGGVYQATNAIYYGVSEKAWFYIDDGRLRHARQNGRNVKREEAEARGWKRVRRSGKHRYLFLLPKSEGHKRWLLGHMKVEPRAYPKHNNPRQQLPWTCPRDVP